MRGSRTRTGNGVILNQWRRDIVTQVWISVNKPRFRLAASITDSLCTINRPVSQLW